MKTKFSLRSIALPPLVAVPLLVALCLSAPAGASAAGMSNAQLAAQEMRVTQTAVSQAIATSPSDADLKAASPAQLVKLAVRCLQIDGLTYCLHRGWEDSPTTAAQDVAAAAAASSMRSNVISADGSGDMSIQTYLRGWAQMPHAQRVAQEQSELADAVAAGGKEVFYTDVVIRQQPLPADFAAAFPSYASWVPLAPGLLAQEKQRKAMEARRAAGVAPASVPDPPVSNHYTAFSNTAKMAKQSLSYYCGPTSLQALVWNSPTSAQYQTQSYWATVLGINTSHATYLPTLASKINSYTTWDTHVTASGPYESHSISGWTFDTLESVFATKLGTGHAPVQLHPKLNGFSNTDYYPGTTSGHFDVGRGYNLDYAGENGAYSDAVYLFEPAGGAAENNVYTPVTATDTFEHVIKANLDNTTQKTIAY